MKANSIFQHLESYKFFKLNFIGDKNFLNKNFYENFR